jgi:hypothetical protein
VFFDNHADEDARELANDLVATLVEHDADLGFQSSERRREDLGHRRSLAPVVDVGN